MSTRDFMIHDIHGHRITSQLKSNGWEIFLLAPVDGSSNEFKLVAECGSIGSAVALAKDLSSGKTVEQIAEERAEAEAPTAPASESTSKPTAEEDTSPQPTAESEPEPAQEEVESAPEPEATAVRQSSPASDSPEEADEQGSEESDKEE